MYENARRLFKLEKTFPLSEIKAINTLITTTFRDLTVVARVTPAPPPIAVQSRAPKHSAGNEQWIPVSIPTAQ